MNMDYDEVIRVTASLRTDLNKARCILAGLIHTSLPQFDSDVPGADVICALDGLSNVVESLDNIIGAMNAVPKEERGN